MFKKLSLLIFVFSPLLFSLFVGFPIVSSKEYAVKVQERPNLAISKRCFAVGDFREFMACWDISGKIRGSELMIEVLDKTSRISYFFSFAIIASFVLFTFFAISLL